MCALPAAGVFLQLAAFSFFGLSWVLNASHYSAYCPAYRQHLQLNDVIAERFDWVRRLTAVPSQSRTHARASSMGSEWLIDPSNRAASVVNRDN